jgi:hypothetical protein
VAELDKDLLESLHQVGFRTNFGYDNTGFMVLAKTKAGGYYLGVSIFLKTIPAVVFITLPDTGGSKLIAEEKIKLKNDSHISHFTERTIVFENGSELDADVVVFATGQVNFFVLSCSPAHVLSSLQSWRDDGQSN